MDELIQETIAVFEGTLLAYVSSEKKYRHPEDIDPREFIVWEVRK